MEFKWSWWIPDPVASWWHNGVSCNIYAVGLLSFTKGNLQNHLGAGWGVADFAFLDCQSRARELGRALVMHFNGRVLKVWRSFVSPWDVILWYTVGYPYMETLKYIFLCSPSMTLFLSSCSEVHHSESRINPGTWLLWQMCPMVNVTTKPQQGFVTSNT
jgi:hypothetical protein